MKLLDAIRKRFGIQRSTERSSTSLPKPAPVIRLTRLQRLAQRRREASRGRSISGIKVGIRSEALSPPEFWEFVDRLPAYERRRLNFEGNSPQDTARIYGELIDRYWTDEDQRRLEERRRTGNASF